MPYTTRTLDGKGRALLPANQVRELVWNISNHPNPCNRSESIETLYKAITFTRRVDDQHVTEAFGASLRPFIEFVITSIFPNDSSGKKPLATSESHFGVLRHLMAAPVVATIGFEQGLLGQLLETAPTPERNEIVAFILNNSCSSEPMLPSNITALSTLLNDASFSNAALHCLEALSCLTCNDAIIGRLLPHLCGALHYSQAPAPLLRVIGNMVTNDCNDEQALQCGLVQTVLHVLHDKPEDTSSRCLALRILASLSSSPAFDSVFCSSGMIQVLCHVFAVGERVSCQLTSRILRNMSIHSDNHPELVSVLAAAVDYIKRLLAVHSVPWATQLPPASPVAIPVSCSIQLRQRGDHVTITEDVAIAVQNMSSLLMHPTQRFLRSSCVAVMHSAPLFFTSLDSDPAVQLPAPAVMSHSLNALASLYPYEVIETLLCPQADVSGGCVPPTPCTAPAAPEAWQVGAAVTAKCPVTKKFRVCKVVQVNERSVQVQFTMPDRSTICAAFPGKLLRAVGPKARAQGSKAGSAEQSAQAAACALAPSSTSLNEDILSLCSLTLLPSMFQQHNYRPLLNILLNTCAHTCAQYRALSAINSLVSSPSFVAHMSAADCTWIQKLAPISTILTRPVDQAQRASLDVLQCTVVSIFDSLLRRAASADQRAAFIEVLVRCRIVHALLQFAQVRDSLNTARDSAASVVLSCAAISPSHMAISWLRSIFREVRRSSSNNVLQDIQLSWAAARESSDDDFDDNRCVISVERYNLVASSVKSFGFCTLQGLARRLKVNFVLERGCDAGGLTVEWLHLLLDAVFSDFAFFLPVLLPNGRPSGLLRVNHSAPLATSLPVCEVFRMVGCCLALCLQLKQSASSRFSLAPSILKFIMRAPLTQADLQIEQPGLAEVLTSIISKTPDEQDEYLSAADTTFTTTSPTADLLELSRCDSSSFSDEQNRCLVQTIARLRQSAPCADAGAELQMPVTPYKDLSAAAAVQVTHANLNHYVSCVTETLCWNNCLVGLAAMRDGFEACMPCTELRHTLVEDVRSALFVPDIDVCEWRRRTVHHSSNLPSGNEKPQIGWFWNYVEQCSQAEKAELLSWWTGMLSLPRMSSGVEALHLTVSASAPSRLVTCSTCSNHMTLPPYSSREQLIAKLRMSVAEKTFGLA